MMKNHTNLKRLISGVFSIIRFALDRGIEKKDLFKGTGMQESSLLDAQNEIPLADELTIIRNLMSFLPEPELAWELARYLDIRANGAIGSMIATAPTIGDIVSCYIDYAVISHSYFRQYPETKGKILRVHLLESQLPKDIVPFLVERDLVAGMTHLIYGVPEKKSQIISSVGFAHSPRTDIEKYQQVLGDNVKFNQPTNHYDIYQSSLNMPRPEGNLRLFELSRQQCQVEFSLRNENQFFLSDRVRLCLQTGKGRVSLNDVAGQLNMSERSLRRSLLKEGVSFRLIRNQYFFQQSLNLLRDPTLQIEEVAEALGYSETCAFTRAFQRWAGMSPGKFRKENIS